MKNFIKNIEIKLRDIVNNRNIFRIKELKLIRDI